MNPALVSFSGMAWADVGEGVREKRAVRGDRVLRLVEFAPPFAEDGWCERGHTGFVVSGGFVLEQERATTVYRAGDAMVIPEGSAHRHRAIVDVPVVLFLIEGLDGDPA